MLSSRRGFTLIELLVVVIASIAVLAAILFPVFSAARESSKKTTCIAHGKQIGSALLAYMGDWNDTFPYQRNIDNYWGPGPTGGSNPEDLLETDLRVLLKPYVKSMTVWNCKSFYGYWGKRYSWNWDTHTGYPSRIYGSYDGLYWDPIGLTPTINGKPKPRRMSEFRPMYKCALYDFFTSDASYIPHQGGTVLIYADGHVRWHKANMFAGQAWLEGYRYPPK